MKNLKENLKDPKKKSIIMLIGYGVFFIFVFIIIATGKTSDTNTSYKDYLDRKETKEEKIDNTVNNYEYVYKINENNKISEITGTKTKEKETFVINGKNYYKEENNIYINDDTNTLVTENVFNTDLYSYESIDNFFKGKTSKEKTIYEDKTSKEIYNINSKEYFDYMKEDKCTNINCTDIIVEVIINKNEKEQIEKVNINLSNYYKHNYLIEITYKNINNIKEVRTN